MSTAGSLARVSHCIAVSQATLCKPQFALLIPSSHYAESSKDGSKQPVKAPKKELTKQAESTPSKAPAPSKATASPPPPPPFDNTKYQCAEYFSFNSTSFYDMMVDMDKARLPQPVAHLNLEIFAGLITNICFCLLCSGSPLYTCFERLLVLEK